MGVDKRSNLSDGALGCSPPRKHAPFAFHEEIKVICSNEIMQNCIYRLMCNKSELIEIQKLYNVDINWSAAKIKAMTYVAFGNIFP